MKNFPTGESEWNHKSIMGNFFSNVMKTWMSLPSEWSQSSNIGTFFSDTGKNLNFSAVWIMLKHADLWSSHKIQDCVWRERNINTTVSSEFLQILFKELTDKNGQDILEFCSYFAIY